VDEHEAPRLVLAVSLTIMLSHHILVHYIGTKYRDKLLWSGDVELHAFAARLRRVDLSDRKTGATSGSNSLPCADAVLRACLFDPRFECAQSLVSCSFFPVLSRLRVSLRTRTVITQLPALPTGTFCPACNPTR